MAKALYQVSLKLIIRRPDGRILLLANNQQSRFVGFYDMPGGRIEDTEYDAPFSMAMKREMKEELGIESIEIADMPVALGRHPLRDGQWVLYVFFEATVSEEDAERIQISDEHAALRWVHLNDEDPSKLFVSGLLEGMTQYLKR